MTRCSKVLQWVNLPMYSLEDVSGKTIDAQRTFQPTILGRIDIAALLKVALLGVCIGSLVYEILYGSPEPSFIPAFLTYWGLWTTMIYFIVSLIGLYFGSSGLTSYKEQDVESNDDEPIGISTLTLPMFQRIIWTLFNLATAVEVVVTLLYWVLVHNETKKLDFSNLWNHSGALIAVMLDGFIIHRFPVRFRQLVWAWLFGGVYVAWSIIHSFSGIGNPYFQDNDPETDDDALYDSLNWNKRPLAASILVVLMTVIAIPLIQGLLWCASMALPRRYK